MFSDDQHVIMIALLHQLTQWTHFITPDKDSSSIPPVFAQPHTDATYSEYGKNTAKATCTV